MFFSILFETRQQSEFPLETAQPDYFKDLNLDQIIAPVRKDGDGIDLSAHYFTVLQDLCSIRYRQAVMRDFEEPVIYEMFQRFSARIFELERYLGTVQAQLTDGKAFANDYLTRSYCLSYVERYCMALENLCMKLDRNAIHSSGLLGFLSYLDDYRVSKPYCQLCQDAEHLRSSFQKIHYCLQIKDGTIKVRPYEGQREFDPEISELFSKFQQGEDQSYRLKLTDRTAHHIEANVLRLLERWYQAEFRELEQFCSTHLYFMDKTVARFAKEVRFYLRWQAFVAPLRERGLPFCYPTVRDDRDHLHCTDGFDLALAQQMTREGATPVVNSFSLDAPEQIMVVTGPNQGGKTTFARAFGQLHHLSCLGCCVPGRSVEVMLFDHILTHFGREEDLSTLNGKLQDDLERLHVLLDRTTGRSVVIINEIFSSTTLRDALFLGRRMMERLMSLGSPGVCVTFLDELASFGSETVSMMSTVRPDAPTERTYKIVRKSADGLAYAAHLAGKYGLTYEALCGRLEP